MGRGKGSKFRKQATKNLIIDDLHVCNLCDIVIKGSNLKNKIAQHYNDIHGIHLTCNGPYFDLNRIRM